jgi:hypothetical protein
VEREGEKEIKKIVEKKRSNKKEERWDSYTS